MCVCMCLACIHPFADTRTHRRVLILAANPAVSRSLVRRLAVLLSASLSLSINLTDKELINTPRHASLFRSRRTLVAPKRAQCSGEMAVPAGVRPVGRVRGDARPTS